MSTVRVSVRQPFARTSRRCRALVTLVAALTACGPAFAQETAARADAPIPDSAFTGFEWRSVGPAKGGRSIAASGARGRPYEYYFGATGGGLWKSTNGGTDWAPVGDGQFRSSSVGALGVCDQNPDVVYAGFGEVQLRGDIIPGDGVYRTTDGGDTWEFLGLGSGTGQQSIGRVRVHPDDCDTVFAAAFGDPFGPSAERGVYRSKDGGRRWERVLYRDDRSGAVDISISPGNPDEIYAGFWEAYRTPWSASSGGEGSGLFKSSDGGDTWVELTGRPGLPTELWGKVAVSVSGADPQRVYANIEAHDGGVFRSDDGGDTWERVSADRNLRTRAFYYTRLTADPVDADTVYVNNEDFWRSTDGGYTWEEIAVPHGDNHDLWIDPDDNRRIIQANDGGANVSVDGGASWTAQDYPTAQMYTIKATQHFPYHVCGAQQDDGTLCVPSDGDGNYWYFVGSGESGWVVPDPVDPDIYYAGSQTTQMTRFDRSTGQMRSIQPWPVRTVGRSAEDVRERFQWTYPIAVSPHDNTVLYTASQHVWKSTDSGRSWRRTSPDLTYADPDTLGPSGGPITLDRTTVEHYGTVFALAPSPLDANVVWAGSDDGRVHVTRDAGESWQDVTPAELPRFSRVHYLAASMHDPSVVYAAVTRYRMQDVAPYVLKSDDYGRSWRNIGSGIRHGDHVRSVVLDPVRPGLLFAGTENGVWVSVDDGAHWHSLQHGLPVSSIHAMVIAGNDLAVATHGRSFWILDDYSPLRQLSPDTTRKRAHLFRPAEGVRSNSRPAEGYRRSRPVSGAQIYYYLRSPAETVDLEILDADGQTARRYSSAVGQAPDALSTAAGLHRLRWDLTYPGPVTFPGMMLRFADTDGPTAPPGTYRVRLRVDGRLAGEEALDVVPDPRLGDVSDEDFREQFELAQHIRDRWNEANEAILLIRGIKTQLADVLGQAADERVVRAAERLGQDLSAVEEQIYEVRLEAKEDQLNFGLKLNNDLAVLMLEVEMGDGPPTEQEYEVFDYLSMQLDGYLNRMDAVLETDLPTLNRLLEDAGLATVAPLPLAPQAATDT